MAFVVNGEKIEDSAIKQEVERLRPDYERVFADQDPNTQARVLLHGFHPELANVPKAPQELSEKQDAQALGLPKESPSLDA